MLQDPQDLPYEPIPDHVLSPRMKPEWGISLKPSEIALLQDLLDMDAVHYMVSPEDSETLKSLREKLSEVHVLRRLKPMAVRAKFICRSKEHNTHSPEHGDVMLEAVISGSPENAEFFNMTPCGHLRMSLLNPAAFAAFEPGQEYYVDFTPAD